MLIDNPSYKGFKIFVNNKIPYCRTLKNMRIIEYNTKFWSRLSKNQEIFMMEWLRRQYRCKDVFKADKITFNWYLAKGGPKDEILDLYRHMNFSSLKHKQQRMFYLITDEAPDKVEQGIRTILSKVNLFSLIKRLWNRKKK